MHTAMLMFALIFSPLDPMYHLRRYQIESGWPETSNMCIPGIRPSLHGRLGKFNTFQGIEVHIFIDFVEFFNSYKMNKAQISNVHDALLRVLAPLQIDIDEMNVNRIDFCYNFEVKSEAERKLLLELWNKTHQEYGHAKRISPKMCKTSNKLYWDCKEYFGIQLYDKELERSDREKVPEPYERSVMRLEYQVRNKHIVGKNREHRHGIRSGRPNTFDAWADWDVRTWYLSKTRGLFFSGDFYNLPRARTKIKQAVKAGTIKKEEKAKDIEQFIIDISQRGMDYAFKKVKEADKNPDAYIKILTQIGVNPILIPRNRGISYLPNPLRSFYEGGCVA